MTTQVTISDKALASQELYKELQNLEALQLKVGADIAKLFLDQILLAERSRTITQAMERLYQL